MDESETTLDEELRRHWDARDFNLFFRLTQERLCPAICNYLVAERNFSLAQSDAEDCISNVIRKLVTKSETGELRTDQNFRYPKAYIWQSCINAAKDFVRAKRQR